MAVGGQRRVRRGVPQGPLHGDDVATGRDQTRGVEVPEVVQAKTGDADSRRGGAPAVADGVLVRWLVAFSSEDPAVLQSVSGDVRGEHLDESRRQDHDPLAAVLRRTDLDLTSAGPLHLPSDGEGATEEVDVLDPKAGGLTKSETCE